MKKPAIIIITVAIVAILILAAIVGVVFINLNKERIPINAYDFKSNVEQRGYIVADANSQFSEYDNIKQVYVAASNDYTYKIDFYEFLDDNTAISFFNRGKTLFESLKESSSAESSVNLNNYSKYTLSSNGKYMVVSRIGNTLMYVNVSDSYKNVVKNLLDELGY